MFAYCNNNPENYVDYSGNRPYGTMPANSNVILYCSFVGGEVYMSPESPEELSFGEKLLQAGQLFLDCLDCSLGIGQGIYAEFEVGEAIGVNLGFYGNYGTINYSDGEFSTGQEFYGGATMTLLWAEYGAAEHIVTNSAGESYTESFWGKNTNQDSLTLFSCAFYPLFVGISIYIGLDTISFCEGLDEIF